MLSDARVPHVTSPTDSGNMLVSNKIFSLSLVCSIYLRLEAGSLIRLCKIEILKKKAFNQQRWYFW